jgi:hypothetical protein
MRIMMVALKSMDTDSTGRVLEEDLQRLSGALNWTGMIKKPGLWPGYGRERRVF